MKRASMFLVLLLLSVVATAQTTTTPTSIDHLSYDFAANQGDGENGFISFLGRGISATTRAGTGASWANAFDFHLPGTTLQPVTFLVLPECCGFLNVAGTTFDWPDDTDQTIVTSNIFGIAGKSFTFPTRPGRKIFSVQVPAKLVTVQNSPVIEMSYGTIAGPRTKLRLAYPKNGFLTLTFSFVPPNAQVPTGFYQFVRGSFVAESNLNWF
jgi:hypothetical protein